MKFPLTMCLAQAVLSHSGSGRGMSRTVGTTSIDGPCDRDSGNDTLGTGLAVDGWRSATAGLWREEAEAEAETEAGAREEAGDSAVGVVGLLTGVPALAEVPRIWAFLVSQTRASR